MIEMYTPAVIDDYGDVVGIRGGWICPPFPVHVFENAVEADRFFEKKQPKAGSPLVGFIATHEDVERGVYEWRFFDSGIDLGVYHLLACALSPQVAMRGYIDKGIIDWRYVWVRQ